jgi:hypothetical protein
MRELLKEFANYLGTRSGTFPFKSHFVKYLSGCEYTYHLVASLPDLWALCDSLVSTNTNAGCIVSNLKTDILLSKSIKLITSRISTNRINMKLLRGITRFIQTR